MLHSPDFDAPELDDIELVYSYERAMRRSAQLRARRARRRALGGTAALACLLAAGLVTATLAATIPGRRAVAGPSMNHATLHRTTWRLVSDLSATGSSWQKLSPSGYDQAFSLVCPSVTTCYADSVGGQLEYTNDGGSTWHRATGTGTATSLPEISCLDAQDCHVLAEIAGRGSTFLTTTDGGQSWTSEPGPPLPPNTLRSGPAANLPGLAMSCATTSSCVVMAYDGASAGSSSEVFRTSDGGTSWSRGALPPPGSLEFVPSGLSCTGTSCVAVGMLGQWESTFGSGGRAQGVRYLSGAAYTSDDGGATWSASPAPPAGANSLTCPDASRCYALSQSAVFETDDSGRTWNRLRTSGLPNASSPSSAWDFTSLACASSASCWLTGAGPTARPPARRSAERFVTIAQAQGLLASTVDSGATWTLSAPPPGVGGVLDVACPSASTCFALGAEHSNSAAGRMKVVLLTNR